MSKPDPIVFGIDLESDPPAFEILFLAEQESDNCVAWVPFDKPVKSAEDANAQAQQQLAKLSAEELHNLECTAARLEQSGVKVLPRRR